MSLTARCGRGTSAAAQLSSAEPTRRTAHPCRSISRHLPKFPDRVTIAIRLRVVCIIVSATRSCVRTHMPRARPCEGSRPRGSWNPTCPTYPGESRIRSFGLSHVMVDHRARVARALTRRYSPSCRRGSSGRVTARTTERSVLVGDGRGAVEVRERSLQSEPASHTAG